MTKILLVEDDDIVSRVAIWRLEKLGYEVCGRATNSAAAVNLAREHHPDLILMDIKIAGPSDGITTAKMLKEVTTAPLVYLTSQSDEETVIRAAETRRRLHLEAIRGQGSQDRNRDRAPEEITGSKRGGKRQNTGYSLLTAPGTGVGPFQADWERLLTDSARPPRSAPPPSSRAVPESYGRRTGQTSGPPAVHRNTAPTPRPHPGNVRARSMSAPLLPA